MWRGRCLFLNRMTDAAISPEIFLCQLLEMIGFYCPFALEQTCYFGQNLIKVAYIVYKVNKMQVWSFEKFSLDEFSSFEQNCGHKTLYIFLKVSLFKKACSECNIFHLFHILRLSCTFYLLQKQTSKLEVPLKNAITFFWGRCSSNRGVLVPFVTSQQIQVHNSMI